MQQLIWVGAMSILLTFVACRSNDTPNNRPDTTESAIKPPNERWGALFEAVQLGGVFPDSKTFVDCTPKVSDAEILAAYEAAKGQSEFHLKAFVLEYFELPPNYAADFQSDPDNDIAEHISELWPILTRQPDKAGRSTLIPLPYAYVVPGGRFREVYYWDSYFTMLGLRVDGKVELIEDMVKNFAYLIDTIGFIPNGNRSYYLTRSQPPFFASMVNLLAEMRDTSIYRQFLPQLEKEYAFWMDGENRVSEAEPALEHVVRMPDGSILNRYYDQGDYPRAESYAEDIETAKADPSRPAADIYRHLRSGAESGWDYTSRWFADGATLATIHTTDIIPIDLNALLFNLEMTIARAQELTGDLEASVLYLRKAQARQQALQHYCWDANTGFFRDYDFVAGRATPVLSLAAVYPLFYDMASPAQAAAVANMLKSEFLRPGGLTTTLQLTGQQWDEPNGWAPLQWLAYKGLSNYGLYELADEIRDRWLANNDRVYGNTGKMVEKYNVNDISLEAGGGEYDLQDGFGWSNGVALRLILEGQE